MKNKTFNKKLFLKKSTIADLSRKEMREVPGGYDITHWTFCDCITIVSCFAHCETKEPLACPVLISEFC